MRRRCLPLCFLQSKSIWAINRSFIDLESVTDVDITVMDITGKTIYFIENETSNQINLNTATLNKGLYFINIQAKGQQRVLKLIKQ